MSEPIQKDLRALKHSKMRESLDGAFGDPLITFTTPKAARKLSQAVDEECSRLEKRVREFSRSSNEPVGSDTEKVSAYINEREQLADEVEAHLKEARRIVREAFAAEPSSLKRKELKKALQELDKTDNSLLKERTALAVNRARVKHTVSGQMNNIRFSEAYMIAVTQTLPGPGDSLYKNNERSTEQSSFRNRLIKAYNVDSLEVFETLEASEDMFQSKGIWCPVWGQYFKPRDMKAAHIIPYSVGEMSAAYLLGSELHEGYDMMWSEKNGLILHSTIKKLLDDGRMVIVPDRKDSNEFVSVILSQALMKDQRLSSAVDAPYSSLHHKRLQFQTAARPGKQYLYVNTLMTLFRRRRYNVPGWENDRSQVLTGKIWATPGKWVRKSMIAAIASEMGDSWGDMDEVEGAGEFPRPKSPEEERKIATTMRYGWESKARDVGVPEELDDGDD